MIDNDQSTIIEAPEVYKSIPTHFPSKNPTTKRTGEKNVNFDTFDGHVMVNYIEPNLKEIIFGPIRVGLIKRIAIPGAGPPIVLRTLLKGARQNGMLLSTTYPLILALYYCLFDSLTASPPFQSILTIPNDIPCI
jgi:hypothetical protein